MSKTSSRESTLRRLVVGRSQRLSKRLVAVAAALFGFTLLFHLPVSPIPFGFLLWPLLALGVIPAVVSAYLNDGVVTCWLLAAGPTLGFYLPLTVFDLGGATQSVLWGLETGVTFGLAFGTAAFFVGASVYRLTNVVRTGVPG